MALDKELFDDLEQQVGSTDTDTPHSLAQLILPFDGNTTNSFNSKNRFDYDRGEIWLTEMPYKGDETQIALCIGKVDNPNQTDAVEYAKDLIRVPLERIVAYFENFNSVTIDGVEYGDPAEVFEKMMEKFRLISYNGDGKTIKVTDQSIISLKIDESADNIVENSENGVIVRKPVLSISMNNSVNIDEASAIKFRIASSNNGEDYATEQTIYLTADNVKFDRDMSIREKIRLLADEIAQNKLTINEDINDGVKLTEKNGVVKGGIVLADNSGLTFDTQGKLKTNLDANTIKVGTLDRESEYEYTLHEALILHKEELVRDRQNGISLAPEVKDRLAEIDTKQDTFTTDDYLQLKNGVLSVTSVLKDKLQKLSGQPTEIVITNDLIGLAPEVKTRFSTIENTMTTKADRTEVDNLRTLTTTKPDKSDLLSLENKVTEKLGDYVKTADFNLEKLNNSNIKDNLTNKINTKAESARVEAIASDVNDLKNEMGTLSFGFEGDTNMLVLSHGTKASQKISVDLSRFVAKGLIKEAKFVGDTILLVFDNGSTLTVPIGNLLTNVSQDVANVQADVQAVKNAMATLEASVNKKVEDESDLLTAKMNALEVKATDNDLAFSDDDEKLTVKVNGLSYQTDLPVFKLEANDKSIEILNDPTSNSLKRINVQIATGKNALSCENNGLYVPYAGEQEITLVDGQKNTIANFISSMMNSIKKIEERLEQLPTYRFTAPLVESAIDKTGTATVSLTVDNTSVIIDNEKLAVGTVDANLF